MRRVLAVSAIALVVVSSITLAWRHQDVADWLALRNYQPSDNISRLVSDTSMTSYARKLFYINQPKLEARDAFNQHCTNEVEQSAVLGCYHGNRRGIYLYDVTDTRLQGVEQTTAAHEMLHQAYDRLSEADRKHIDGLLQDYYKKGTLDQIIKNQIEAYKKSEPEALANEMHSLFGTEVTDLPRDLERYYGQYFDDRAKVVAFNNAYQSEFTKRKQQVAAYDRRLQDLKEQIKTKERSLDERQNAIRQKKSELDRQAGSNQVDQYNANVATYNSMAQAYNQELARARELINQYNRLVEERNAIAVQEQQLQQALDSRLTPVGGR